MPTKSDTKKQQVESARAVLARNLVRVRGRRQLSQEALALEAGVHRTYVTHVERQKVNPSLDNIERLANALAVPVAELLKP